MSKINRLFNLFHYGSVDENGNFTLTTEQEQQSKNRQNVNRKFLSNILEYGDVNENGVVTLTPRQEQELKNNKHTEKFVDNLFKYKQIIQNIKPREDPRCNLIKTTILNNNTQHNDLMISCLEIYKKYPPSKNEYKFAFGGLIQDAFIPFLNDIFYKCDDLDKNWQHGAEYKVDCGLFITESNYLPLSIKAKSKKNGNIILINKHSNDRIYDLNDLITIVIVLETKDILIIPYNEIDKIYVKNNQANISYKSSLITHIYRERPELIIPLRKNEKYNSFMDEEYDEIESININDRLRFGLKHSYK